MLYAAGDDGGLQSARIANLACTAHGIHESSALNNKAPIQDTRAFIDIAEAEAGKIQARHIVLICSHSAFNRLLHQSPAFGNSYTLCASDWEKFLDNYVKIWSPFDLDCEHPDEARKMADRISTFHAVQTSLCSSKGRWPHTAPFSILPPVTGICGKIIAIYCRNLSVGTPRISPNPCHTFTGRQGFCIAQRSEYIQAAIRRLFSLTFK